MSNTVKTTLKTIIGSICIATGFLLCNTNEAIVQWSTLNVSQLLFGRCFIQWFMAVLWWNIIRPRGQYVNNWYGDSPFIINIWSRAVFYNIHMISLWYSMKRLPVGDGNSILVQNVLLTALLANMFFKEKLPKTFLFIAIFGITGSFSISQPSFILRFIEKYVYYNNNSTIEPLNIDGIIAIIIAIVSWSLSSLLIRSAKEAHFIQLEIVSAGLMIFISIPLMLFLNSYAFHIEFYGTLNFHDTWNFDSFSILIMITTGFIGFWAISLHVIGYQYGDATKVSWLEYMTIVYSCTFQAIIFDDPLNLYEWIGVILIITACITNMIEQYYDYLKAKHQYQLIQTTSSPSDDGDDLVSV